MRSSVRQLAGEELADRRLFIYTDRREREKKKEVQFYDKILNLNIVNKIKL